MTRRGWTLQEMLIALLLTGGIIALSAQLALGQLRYFQGIGALIAIRGQIGHASTIVARALRDVSPAAGDIMIALDSAIEFNASVGSAVACESSPGRVMLPQPHSQSGNTLSAFWDSPESGDRVHVFYNDSVGATWLTLHVAEPPALGASCQIFEDLPSSWLVVVREPIAIPTGATLRFTRPVRFSLYESSDRRWYLGVRDWNGDAERLNTIQPIAGPLRPYSRNPSESGLVLRYHDAAGAELLPPADPSRILSITITARAETETRVMVPGLATSAGGKYADSSSIAVALRNSQ